MIPSLDELAAQPNHAATLPREACLQLIAKAAAVQAVLVARFSETTADGDQDDTLNVEQAARLLGVSSKTLANGSSSRYKSLRLPNLSRRLAFSRRAILALQQNRGLVLGSPGLTLLQAPGRKRRGQRLSALSTRLEEGGVPR